MKSLLRSFLINASALWATSYFLPALRINGGIKGLAVGSLAFMLVNALLVPLVRILLLPLNLLTLGLFAWLANVLAFYALVRLDSNFQIEPFFFPGSTFNGFIIPSAHLTPFQVVIVASLVIGAIIHCAGWLVG